MNNKFWIYNLKELYEGYQIIPNKKECMEKQLNSVTRFVILTFIILLIFDIKISILFLFFSLLFIIIIYYIKRDKMQISENYVNEPKYAQYGKPGRHKKPLQKKDKSVQYGSKKINILKNDKKEFECSVKYYDNITDKTKTEVMNFQKLNEDVANVDKEIGNIRINIKTYSDLLKKKIQDMSKGMFIQSIDDLVVEIIENNNFRNTCKSGIPLRNDDEDFSLSKAKKFTISNKLCDMINNDRDVTSLVKNIRVLINKLNTLIEQRELDSLEATGSPSYATVRGVGKDDLGKFLQNKPTVKPSLLVDVNDGVERYLSQSNYKKIDDPVNPSTAGVLLQNSNNLCPKLTKMAEKQQYVNYYEGNSMLRDMMGSGTLDKLGGNPRTNFAPNIAKPIVSHQWNPESVPSYINDANVISRNVQGFATSEEHDYNIKERPMNTHLGNRSLDSFVADVQPGITGNFEFDNQCSTLQGPRNKIILPLKEHFKYSGKENYEEKMEKDEFGYPWDKNMEVPTIKNPNLPPANPHNVYDPRSYGYGDENRGYIDKMTGQIKFFYDDVNAIRQPNYVTRNNIDFMKNVGTRYGQVQESKHTDPATMRQQIHREYLDNQLKFRNELQVRLLNKGNNVAAQRKSFPVRFQ